MNKNTAVYLTHAITGKERELGDPLVGDTVGELLNMIVGSAQRESAAKFHFGLPVCIGGREHLVRPLLGVEFRQVVSTLPTGEIGLYLTININGTST